MCLKNIILHFVILFCQTALCIPFLYLCIISVFVSLFLSLCGSNHTAILSKVDEGGKNDEGINPVMLPYDLAKV